MHNHHHLGEQGGKAVLIIVVAAEKQDIPRPSGNRTVVRGWLIITTTYWMEKTRQGSLNIALEIRIAVSQDASYK
jgi:hypothetical protein